MNILFVADVSISSVIGGAERVLFEQSARLAQRGRDVHVLTRMLPVHMQNQEVIQGVKEWRYDVNYQKGAVSFLKSTCHSLSFEEYISRNSKPDKFVGENLYFLNIFIRKWLEKSLLKKSDDVVTLSQFTRDKLWRSHKVPSTKVSIIPGGVDLKRFQPADDKMKIRQRYNIPPNKVILFTVRNLVPRMGLENLIVAIQKATKSTPDIYIVIGGEGPLKNDLIELVNNLGLENHIQFVGFIAEEELADYYRMADLFILPTRELEGFGLVTLKALACGVPVLGTPIGGTKEILSKFDPSFLFEDTSTDAMAALILKNHQIIKKNPKEWSDLSRRCRKFVEENYSWEKNVDSLEKIFFEHQ